ncbi:MAG: Transketolase, pyridine binding subunit [candidate division WWE3 bacterium GW2011_GWB1_44_4]|uniref:Transketolase, pyridine binding subunit n=3 Tax=Katanobacteria TaxID=422282 RepID=A0A0G1NLT2_UNCKA|nr:MAG: Transketolase, pyridine binding subunit [candidate division WWE3 bacterium GW2011_GWB1_44_4]KKT85154.1 MAG: Transketolase, pyridine binding subunit [candidate division WWE3 bacterium GW2011_GWC2_44_9]
MPLMEFKSTREGYGDALDELGQSHANIALVCADLTKSTESHKFAQHFPEKFIQIGVAEQNMAGIAAGLASTGMTVFMTSYAAFNPGRNFDFIRTQICYSNLNVKIIGSHAGFSDGGDGATHQMLEDVGLMRSLPNMTVLSPCDYWEAKKAIYAACKIKGPVYIRLYRESTAVITKKAGPFEIGKWQTLAEGNDVCIIGHGPVCAEALLAKEKLQEKSVSAQVVSACSIKPLDTDCLLALANSYTKLLVVEEHQKACGLGSAICEYLADKHPVKVTILGANDVFGQSGKYHELLAKHKLDAKGICASVLELLEEKNST